MIYATGISFYKNEGNKNLKSIVRIQLESTSDESWRLDEKVIKGWYEKEKIHDWLKSNKEKDFEIKIKISPYSQLEPVENNGVKYVRAVADETLVNNLLELKNYYES
ncbi:hypothetical protein SCA05_25930 [Staphylococcus carnosus]|uniref:Uncharacterized protein n=1 Tax=Staphylococcus carnosus TaxID=1281 RepID=A0AAJ0JME3_STACA|nr:DUF3892 domain-containing protein [Staphylococcus carnosus]KKB24250.1 hypothetical protein VV61_12790 [Staphylococcus carnosus]POA01459.1 DUF3892 domain-containing protein [Staphylococcus carnosus]GEP80800.1 hypothetical protein SCA05_25930 [Staphylococcus carnosus]